MAFTKSEINHSQFYRYETYGRAAQKQKEGTEKKGTKKGGKTMYDIVGEADRQEGYTEHLENPEEPVLLYGVPYSEAVKAAEEWCEQNKEIRHDKKKKKRFNELTGEEEEYIEIVERKIALKKTAQCCIAGVISAPPDMTEEDWKNYRDDSVEFLKKKFGNRLKTVVEHTDENYNTENFKDVLHLHLHFFVVPEINEKIEDIHPGLKAKREADFLWGDREASAKATKEERSLSRRTGDKAYRNAMREEQDEFYDAVSYKYNLNRKGKKRCEHFKRDEYLEWSKDRNENARAKAQLQEQEMLQSIIAEQQEEKEADLVQRESKVADAEKNNFEKSIELSLKEEDLNNAKEDFENEVEETSKYYKTQQNAIDDFNNEYHKKINELNKKSEIIDEWKEAYNLIQDIENNPDTWIDKEVEKARKNRPDTKTFFERIKKGIKGFIAKTKELYDEKIRKLKNQLFGYNYTNEKGENVHSFGANEITGMFINEANADTFRQIADDIEKEGVNNYKELHNRKPKILEKHFEYAREIQRELERSRGR